MCSPILFLRRVALVEAVSFLLLIGLAMPLKYLAGMPMAVKVIGWIHGLLFVFFCFALLCAMWMGRWPLLRSALVFFAALVPFGPFLLDRRMRAYEEEFQQRHRLYS